MSDNVFLGWLEEHKIYKLKWTFAHYHYTCLLEDKSNVTNRTN